MPGCGQAQLAPAQKFDGGAADRRSEPARNHTPAGDALDAALNRSPRSQSLMQLRGALDDSPRVQALQGLAGALNRPREEKHDEPERLLPDVSLRASLRENDNRDRAIPNKEGTTLQGVFAKTLQAQVL